MITVGEIVKGHTATFQYYKAGHLYYKTSSDFEFPIPISDTDSVVFPAETKAITFMRWIRAHHKILTKIAEAELLFGDNIPDGYFEETPPASATVEDVDPTNGIVTLKVT